MWGVWWSRLRQAGPWVGATPISVSLRRRWYFLTQDRRPQLSNNSFLTAVGIDSILMETTFSVRLEHAARPEAASNFTWVSLSFTAEIARHQKHFHFPPPNCVSLGTLTPEWTRFILVPSQFRVKMNNLNGSIWRDNATFILLLCMLSGDCCRDTRLENLGKMYLRFLHVVSCSVRTPQFGSALGCESWLAAPVGLPCVLREDSNYKLYISFVYKFLELSVSRWAVEELWCS